MDWPDCKEVATARENRNAGWFAGNGSPRSCYGGFIPWNRFDEHRGIRHGADKCSALGRLLSADPDRANQVFRAAIGRQVVLEAA
jgi:hypothetical protein